MNCSTVSFEIGDVRVNPDRIKKIERFFSNEKLWGKTVWGFTNVKFLLDQDRLVGVQPEEYTDKFRDGELMAKLLAKAIVKGTVRLHFENGDDYWGYQIEEGGKVEVLQKTYKKEVEV